MLLQPGRSSLAQLSDEVLARLSRELSRHVSPETHASVLELTTGIPVSLCASSIHTHPLLLLTRLDWEGLHSRPFAHPLLLVLNNGNAVILFGTRRGGPEEVAVSDPLYRDETGSRVVPVAAWHDRLTPNTASWRNLATGQELRLRQPPRRKSKPRRPRGLSLKLRLLSRHRRRLSDC